MLWFIKKSSVDKLETKIIKNIMFRQPRVMLTIVDFGLLFAFNCFGLGVPYEGQSSKARWTHESIKCYFHLINSNRKFDFLQNLRRSKLLMKFQLHIWKQGIQLHQSLNQRICKCHSIRLLSYKQLPLKIFNRTQFWFNTIVKKLQQKQIAINQVTYHWSSSFKGVRTWPLQGPTFHVFRNRQSYKFTNLHTSHFSEPTSIFSCK